MPLGRIFSIEEFSTYDGPGIRMTVFMKGCPLRCMWCHNPEGQRFESEIARSPNGCISCGACMKCGEELTGTPGLTEKSIEVCPRSLIRRCGEDMSEDELVGKILKNAAILNMSGGGVTFSGGEPLCHAEFIKGCLVKLRGKTDRALQTCGYAESAVFCEMLSELDYVLYDLKLMDDVRHRHYTGVSNERILENYSLLAERGVPFITRIPLIPTVNDTAENIEATARFMNKHGASKIELLPYNKMAGGKYKMLGREYVTDFDGNITPEVHKDIFNEYGIEVKIL